MRFSDTQDQDFIPILTEEDEAAINDSPLPDSLPLLSPFGTPSCFPGW